MSSNNIMLKRSWKNGAILVLLLNFFTTALFAQNVVVKGTVKDDLGEPLAGAYVIQVGTNNGVAVSKDGTFVLKNVAPGSNLKASFVGYKPVILTLKNGQVNVNFTLISNIVGLKEVTVNTGLYKRPVGNFTGSAKTYTGEELKMVNPRNVIQALAVVDPAVRITSSDKFGSDPNQLPNLQIRGANNLTLTTNQGASTPVSNGDLMSSYLSNPNQPLIIMDGFETTLQTLYDMDVNLIGNITVLKDAAATTAYGSKAANGVIVVETKQPAFGKLKVTYGINANIELVDLSSYNLMNAEEVLEAQRLAGIYNDPSNHFNDVGKQQWYDYRLAQVKSGVNTYWLSQPLQVGYGLSHSLGLSGGGSQFRYSLSFNYNNGQGVIKGSGRDRYALTYNMNYIGKKIKVTNSMALGYMDANNSPWGSFDSYSKQFPYLRNNDDAGNPFKVLEPKYYELGFNVAAPGGVLTNPSYNATLNIKDYNTNLSLTNNTSFEWSITDDLKFTSSLGWMGNNPNAEVFFPADHTSFLSSALARLEDLGSYQQVKGNNSALTGRTGLNYVYRIGRSSFMAVVGGSLQKTSSNSSTVKVYGIPNEDLGEMGLANGFTYNSVKPNSTSNLSKSYSTFASLSYNYADRYTAEVTANRSASSQFGSNSKSTPFYAAGLSWNITKENFFKPNPIIETAKLRASIGTTGNQNFSSDMSQQIYQYMLSNNYRLMLGTITTNYANPNLDFQATLKSNVGLSLGLFKGKINASFEYFRETTDNLILPLDVAPSTGFVSYSDNLGGIRNEGFELGIGANIIRDAQRNIFWTVGFNTGHYSNIITKLSPAIDAINNRNNLKKNPNSNDEKFQTSPLPRFEVGQSMSRIWAVPSLGIDPATGKEVFLKLDGSRTFVWDANDKRAIADATAKFKGSASSNFNYKNFVFNFNLMYSYGGYKYNQTLVDKVENVNLSQGNADRRVLTERWKQPGDHTSFKALVADGSNLLTLTNATSRFVQKDNYVELASVTVGYNFPSNLKWVKAARLSTPKLMITQNNLAHWGTIKTERGTSYPFSRSLSFGLTTNF